VDKIVGFYFKEYRYEINYRYPYCRNLKLNFSDNFKHKNLVFIFIGAERAGRRVISRFFYCTVTAAGVVDTKLFVEDPDSTLNIFFLQICDFECLLMSFKNLLFKENLVLVPARILQYNGQNNHITLFLMIFFHFWFRFLAEPDPDPQHC
jgi:hypothetical protein